MMQMNHIPLQNRRDFQNLAEHMLSCALNKLSPQKAWLHAGETGTKYPQKTAWTEGFLRPLFGLVPLSAGDSQGRFDYLWESFREGIANGTDPDSAEYWGPLEGKDQKIVEMTTLGLALALVPEKVWDPLTDQEKKHLEQWLLLINDAPLSANNWLFFPVIVNLGLKRAGAFWRPDIVEQALAGIEACYLSDGWYSDGPSPQRDYYIPFAMHFYGLIYAQLMETEDPVRAARFRSRAAAFAQDFLFWFSSQGDALPFGRRPALREKSDLPLCHVCILERPGLCRSRSGSLGCHEGNHFPQYPLVVKTAHL